jgi:hypothetical protein
MATLQVEFTGICAFVPDVEFDDPNPAKNPTQVMVLMVDGVPRKPPAIRKGLDGDVLRAHAPVIALRAGDLESHGDLPDAAELRLSINRKEVSFVIKEIVADSNKFEVVQRTGTNRDFGHTIHIKELIDKSYTYPIWDDCFKDQESKGLISARVKLAQGTLSTTDLVVGVEFDVAKTLGGKFSQRPLADRVMLEFKNVDTATLVLKDMDTADEKSIILNRSATNISLTLGNLCGDSWLPRVRNDDPKPIRLTGDEDFRWFYELFVDGVKFQKMLNELPLPFPIPVSVQGGTGLQPVQCMGLGLHAHSL